jgi:hypothetical protein
MRPIVHDDGGRVGTNRGCEPNPNGSATDTSTAGTIAPAH